MRRPLGGYTFLLHFEYRISSMGAASVTEILNVNFSLLTDRAPIDRTDFTMWLNVSSTLGLQKTRQVSRKRDSSLHWKKRPVIPCSALAKWLR